MRWTVHGRRALYESDWVNLWLEDVELPDGQRLEHHVLRMPRRSVTVVVLDEDGERVLLLSCLDFDGTQECMARKRMRVAAGPRGKNRDMRACQALLRYPGQ